MIEDIVSWDDMVRVRPIQDYLEKVRPVLEACDIDPDVVDTTKPVEVHSGKIYFTRYVIRDGQLVGTQDVSAPLPHPGPGGTATDMDVHTRVVFNPRSGL